MKRLILFGVLALCLFAACKKSDDKKVIGSWRMTYVSYDTNNNRMLDAGERIDASDETITYNFKKGGKLEINDGSLIYHCTWDLKDDGDVLAIIFQGVEQHAKVLTLDTDMKLEYDDDGEVYWEEFKKQ